MIVATVRLQSQSPYSQSKHYTTEKLPKELHKDYEARTWRDRCHADKQGNLFIPAMAFKNCLAEAAKYLSEQVPGKGKSTYTKHFEAGVMVLDNVPLPESKDTVEGEWLFVPSDGIKGSGKRVEKCFPVIDKWEAEVQFYVLDHTITEDVFKRTLEQAGALVGIGRFRPRNGGLYGRFKVASLTWEVQG